MKTAVLVIDVQQGLCQGSGAAFDAEGTIARINVVTAKARAAGKPVIFIQHESDSRYLARDTEEWQLAKDLVVDSQDMRMRKTTPDSFLRTDLEPLLRSMGVKTVVICGMHTEYCVDTTTRRALALGFPVTLVTDAHTSAGNSAITAQQVIAHHNITLPNIGSFGPRVTAVTSADLVI